MLGLFGKPTPLDDQPMVFPVGLSRSGTTLLATVLDSHPRIAMGYELIPPRLPRPARLAEALAEGLAATDGDFAKAGGAIRKSGGGDGVGYFLARAHRTGIGLEAFQTLLAAWGRSHGGPVRSARDRLALAAAVVAVKKHQDQALLAGFKVDPSMLAAANRCFPQGRFLYILRDPRDVVASQRQRHFDRSAATIARVWNACLGHFEAFAARHSGRALLVRYEDLVERPRETLEQVFAILPVPFDEAVLAFYQSKASIHASCHPNRPQLERDFFTTSVGRWRADLPADLAGQIARRCRDGMSRHGYR